MWIFCIWMGKTWFDITKGHFIMLRDVNVKMNWCARCGSWILNIVITPRKVLISNSSDLDNPRSTSYDIEMSQLQFNNNYRTYPYKCIVKQFRSLQITASFVYFLIKAYVLGTHLNCVDLSMQFKWAPTTYAFIKKIISDLFYNGSLVGRYIFYHRWVFQVILKNLSARCGN